MSDQAVIDVRPPDLATARAVGQVAQKLATDAAERRDPDFRPRAEAAILAKLAAGPATSEDITDHVQACGVPMKDGRALGSIYRSMRDRGLIRIVGVCFRKRGHGTAGGHIWAMEDAYEAQKAAWQAMHPAATPEQYEAACQAIAERLGV